VKLQIPVPFRRGPARAAHGREVHALTSDSLTLQASRRPVAGEGPVVRATDLYRTFKVGDQEVHAVSGVSLVLERGQLIALRGRSGSGKTTLLNLLGTLDRPDKGSIWIEGRDLSKMSDGALTRLRRREIGFVFQSFALLPTLSALENVELPMHIAGVSRRQRMDRARECLDLVGLGRRAGHRPFELSGGEQQRVAIARALSNRPSFILADEPTGELDSVTGLAIMELFRRVVMVEGVTVIIATHDIAIDEIAHVTYELSDGAVIARREPANGEVPVGN
jgi:putative ABC transport system ATP-binding protein